MADTSVLRDLGDGLVLRQAMKNDADALGVFNSLIHGGTRVGAFTRDLVGREHLGMSADNFTIVENTATGEIISSLCLIPQTWTYDGIPFGAGQIELVGTLPDYRNRGLMRIQMEVAHQWSVERGHLVQVIAGIPYYYRQFGYEMCVNLGGHHVGYLSQLPKLAEGQPEPFVIRPATEADIPFMARLYNEGCKRSLMACVRDEIDWRYDLFGRSEDNMERRLLCIIESAQGGAVGFFAYSPWLFNGMMRASAYELAPEVSWRAVTPSVMRYIHTVGQAAAERDKEAFTLFGFHLGGAHPVYEVFPETLPIVRKLYTWYMRVPDRVGFLRHIQPALERRLAASVMAGYSGTLTIGFYKEGLRVAIDQGKIIEIDSWKPSLEALGSVVFPDLTFLQVLFGHRSLNELRHAFADCFTTNEEAQVLVDSLFVKQASNVWAVA